jgi:hypothetical protein
MFSNNLRNSEYYFENKQLSKDEYIEKIKDYISSRKNITNAISKFENEVIKNKIRKYASVINSNNSY